jgi:hypothetical protein
MAVKKHLFRAAGYVFVWSPDPSKAEVDLEMHRESASRGERYFIARTRCPSDRGSISARALAMVAWVRSLGVPVRRDAQAQAVLEQLAVTNDRMSRMRTVAPRVSLALDQMLEGRAAAA